MPTTALQMTKPKPAAQKTASKPHSGKTELATFAAGCFWGVEELYRTLPGVLKTQVGYTGGATPNPTYDDVCSDETGHAEAVQITYDPSKITYEKLLQLFWENHDPTTKDRQGFDVGAQYRSAIFYHSGAQKKAAEKSKKEAQAALDTAQTNSLMSKIAGKRTVVTQILPAEKFYPAEDYHQQYLAKRGAKVCH